MNDTQRQIIDLVAAERLFRPITSMAGKLERQRPKLARAIDLDPYKGKFNGERAYARVVAEDKLKSRTIREGVDQFAQEHPKMGQILNQMIEDSRSVSETHMYFGMQTGCRLTADDYLTVMDKLGFNEAEAQRLYEPLMQVSRKMANKKGDIERSILIG